ncbi:FAD/NAD(P)-binding protein [Sphingomonas morindae]|uniref:FAD/NAD(P)-binding protein n=1 Tax=Sphingomonas morindae TaxID=1541170 RepID=A0ABY4X3H8_9SPHN|nr:FAD/NAD(P)-binding protein [Sphingomonas morindae]USI71439.1 FAD/NAD(P)-binding protein [Sphingomonas morindae]
MPDHVAIIGGGFSGALLAINLLRHDGPRATLIERRAETARGVAYSTVHPEHVLNVRAAGMSALPDEPDHFLRWLAARGLHPREGFASRRDYGAYLDDLLAETQRHAGDRLRVVRDSAVDAAFSATAATVRLAGGGAIAADTVALATGNLPPLLPPGLDVEGLDAGRYIADPWGPALAEGLKPGDCVGVLGTGLTMVDVALALDGLGFEGRIFALSRRGLIPRPHAAGPPGAAAAPRSERPTPEARALLAELRARAEAIGWRAAVDELRPFTQGLWRAMPLAERRRFLRHARAWWDVHRHRIAPHVAERLADLQARGRLTILAGTPLSLTPRPDGMALSYRPRGETGVASLTLARLINGTGPQGNLTRTAEPLLAALHARGLLRPDPLRIGIDVDQQSRAIGRDGRASDRLLVLGPPTRGAFWEIVAVPDIRRQAWAVARRLANAQWVGGEGL